VIGIRGLWNGCDITGSREIGPGDAVAGSDHVKIDSLATRVGKLGFLLHPALQLHGLAGVAWVHDRYFVTSPNSGEVHSGKQSRTGYDVGAGLS
jgi:opacity protein-like surface antigen